MSKHLHTTLADLFKYFTSPIRPCSDDIEIVRQQLSLLNKPARGILLGVTKELAELANDEIKMIAVDRSTDMIEHHWIGNNSNRIVKLADWIELESIATNVNFVIGDGVFNVIDRKSQHHLMDSIRNVLTHDGLLIVRVPCSPVVRETIEQIFENTTNNFSAFLQRLVNSICDSNYEVRGSKIYNKFKESVTDKDIARFRWTKEDISIIEAHKNSSHVITFLTEQMFTKLCHEHQMKILSKFNGSYKLNEQNSTFIICKA